MILEAGLLKGLGIAATVVGVGAHILGDWVADKQLDQKVTKAAEEAVKTALKNQTKGS